MANPLRQSGTPGALDLQSGETRTFMVGDKPFTLHRTERDFVHDLCDCYNAARSGSARFRGLEWYVSPSGELRLGDSAAWSRIHTRALDQRVEAERARYAQRAPQ